MKRTTAIILAVAGLAMLLLLLGPGIRGTAAAKVGGFTAWPHHARVVHSAPSPASSPTKLVDPNGSPLDSRLQDWADENRMPSIPLLTIMPDASACPGTTCSESPQALTRLSDGSLARISGSRVITFVSAQTSRWDFYYELGHHFDWAYLTDADRAQLAAWHHESAPWWDSLAGLVQGREDGIEGIFPAWYAECAEGERGVLIRTCALIQNAYARHS